MDIIRTAHNLTISPCQQCHQHQHFQSSLFSLASTFLNSSLLSPCQQYYQVINVININIFYHISSLLLPLFLTHHYCHLVPISPIIGSAVLPSFSCFHLLPAQPFPNNLRNAQTTFVHGCATIVYAHATFVYACCMHAHGACTFTSVCLVVIVSHQ